MEGEIALKNMKRNKKKYRITILSLFVSIVLFIAFSGYMKYALSGIDSYTELPNYDAILSYYLTSENRISEKDYLEEIAKNTDIKKLFQYHIYHLVTDTNLNKKEYYNDKFYELEQTSIARMDNVLLLQVNDKTYQNMLKAINKKEIKLKALELLNNMNLKDRCNHFPKELSGGEQQRVAIARALINNPTIILADEPTGSLDPENETKILKILKKLSDDGKCVIVVSHSNEILRYADKVLKIKDGELI